MQAHQSKVQEALKAAETDLGAKSAEVARMEAAMKRANTDIERKTRELESLNRRLAKMTSSNPQDEDLGAYQCFKLVYILGQFFRNGIVVQFGWASKCQAC